MSKGDGAWIVRLLAYLQWQPFGSSLCGLIPCFFMALAALRQHFVPRPCHVHRSLRSVGLLPEEAGHMRSGTVLIRQWERDTWGFVPRAFAPLLEANGRRMRDIEYLSLTVCPLL